MLYDILNRSVIYRIVAQLYRKYLLMKQLTLNDAEMMFEVIIYMLLEYKFDSQTSVMDHNASNDIIDN